MLTAMHMKTAWQTFGHILVNALQLPIEAFPLYTTDYQVRANRLLRQLLRDGHGGRPAKGDCRLMKRFGWERPKKNRLLQKGYTACRLLFEAWQMAKFFPDLAWHELRATLISL